MYAQAKVKRNIIPRNVAHRIVNRGVQKCTCAGASLRSKKCAPLNCINLDTATDGACGTGGMLTVAQDRLLTLAARRSKEVSIHLFGQEVQPETYAICKADMLLKGDGDQAEHIAYGSTLSADGNATRQFDFMLANPPYGKSWKTDAEKMGGKKDILDSRFNTYLEDGTLLQMLPKVSDGQLLFLLNNVAKMKKDTPLGSRIAEVHNGSSLFTGDAGSGESNARRFLFENDLVEAIIALPEGMFYNTPLGTFIWVLTNRKSEARKGKVQLINATEMKQSMWKNMGKKNSELTPDIRKEIIRIFTEIEENSVSKVLNNEEFGHWRITILQPEYDENGVPKKDKKGRVISDKNKTDTAIVPFTYPGGIRGYMETEVIPYAQDAWFDEKKTQIGYELTFTKYFFEPRKIRSIEEVSADIKDVEKQMAGILSEVLS